MLHIPPLPPRTLERLHSPRLPRRICSPTNQGRGSHICARFRNRVLDDVVLWTDDGLWHCVPCEERGGDVEEPFWTGVGCLCEQALALYPLCLLGRAVRVHVMTSCFVSIPTHLVFFSYSNKPRSNEWHFKQWSKLPQPQTNKSIEDRKSECCSFIFF